MGEMENQAEFYYEKLKNSTNPAQVLLEFFTEFVGKQGGRSEIIMFNKLLRMYGRFTVFFAIQDLTKYEHLEGNLYPLVYTICKNRFEKAHEISFNASHQSLDKEIKALQKEIEKMSKHKTKFPTSEGL